MVCFQELNRLLASRHPKAAAARAHEKRKPGLPSSSEKR
jgi:hypothetical protein